MTEFIQGESEADIEKAFQILWVLENYMRVREVNDGSGHMDTTVFWDDRAALYLAKALREQRQ